MKKLSIHLSLFLTLLGAANTAQAVHGFFNYQYRTYYANEQQHYCEVRNYVPHYPEISYWEAQQLEYYTFDGMCIEEGWLSGFMNYQFRSYYGNGRDAYCSCRYYDSSRRPIGHHEYNELIRLRYDGICGHC